VVAIPLRLKTVLLRRKHHHPTRRYILTFQTKLVLKILASLNILPPIYRSLGRLSWGTWSRPLFNWTQLPSNWVRTLPGKENFFKTVLPTTYLDGRASARATSVRGRYFQVSQIPSVGSATVSEPSHRSIRWVILVRRFFH
jgi:hypothetical protein